MLVYKRLLNPPMFRFPNHMLFYHAHLNDEMSPTEAMEHCNRPFYMPY